METHLDQIKDMTIGQLIALAEDHKRISKELEYIKIKYPKSREDVKKIKEEDDANSIVESCCEMPPRDNYILSEKIKRKDDAINTNSEEVKEK